MSTIDSYSSFNIEGSDLEKGKSSIDFSALHILEALETPYNQNPNLLSPLSQENEVCVEDKQNSFLIIDEYFRKPVLNIESTQAEDVFQTEIETIKTDIVFESQANTIEQKFLDTDVMIDLKENPIQVPPVLAEKRESLEVLPVLAEKRESLEVLPVLAEKRENLEVIPVFEEKIQGAEGNENLATLAENIAENKENKQNFRENEIFLRKKHNLLVKIVVNEGEFAHYFDAKDTELLTETDNMSPETTSIIDQFLAKEPKLPRSRNFIGQKEMPVENLLQPDEEEIVTETMAYLYASQGNKAEAMRIYEKLSLQFPEKRLYFAARIKSVINS